jgi:hypothetical protein
MTGAQIHRLQVQAGLVQVLLDSYHYMPFELVEQLLAEAGAQPLVQPAP